MDSGGGGSFGSAWQKHDYSELDAARLYQKKVKKRSLSPIDCSLKGK